MRQAEEKETAAHHLSQCPDRRSRGEREMANNTTGSQEQHSGQDWTEHTGATYSHNDAETKGENDTN